MSGALQDDDTSQTPDDAFDTSGAAPAPAPDTTSAPAPTPAATPVSTGPAIRPSTRARGFDLTGFQPTGDPVGVEADTTTPTPSASKHGWLHDMAAEAWNSVRATGQDLVGLGSAINDQTLNSPDVRDFLKSAKDGLQDDIQKSLDSMSPERKAATNASFLRAFGLGPDTDEQGNHIPSPGEVGWGNYISSRIAENLPMVGALVLAPESLVGKIAVSGLFGATNAGQTYNQIVDGIEKEPDAKYQSESPAYRELRQSGLTEQQAKLKAAQGTWLSVLGAAGLGAAAGAGLGTTMGRGAVATSGSWIARKALGAVEGAVPMAAQQGGDTAIQQATQEALGQRDNLDLGEIARQTASGAMGGAALGVVMGGRKAPVKEEEKPPTPGVPADTSAALNAAGVGKPPGGDEGPPGGAAAPARTEAPQPEPQPAPEPAQAEPQPAGAAPQEPPPEPVQAASTPAAPEPQPEASTQPTPQPGESAAAPESAPPPEAEATLVATQAEPEAQTMPAQPAGGSIEVPPTSIPGTQVEQTTPGTPVRPANDAPLKEWKAAVKALDPDADKFAVNRMKRVDLQARYDELSQQAAGGQRPSGQGPGETTRVVEGAAAQAGAAAGPAARASEDTPARAPSEGQAGERAAPPPSRVAEIPMAAEGEQRTLTPVVKTEGEARAETQTQGEAQAHAKTEPAPAATSALAGGEMGEHQEEALAALANVRRTIKVPKGTPMEPLVNKLMQQIQTEIGNARSHADVVQMLQRLRDVESIRKITPTLAGVRERIAARMLKAMGEHETVEEARAPPVSRAEEIAAARQEEEQRGGAEARSPEAIEEKATGGGEGESAGQTMGLEATHAKVRKTTDLRVKARQWIHKALDPQDPTSWHDADREFGKQSAGPGRPRREGLSDLATAVRDEIARVDDPAKVEKLRDQLRQALIDEAGEEHEGEGEPTSRRIERLLEDYAPERVEGLREGLKTLEDPVGKAVDDQARVASRDEALAKLKGQFADRPVLRMQRSIHAPSDGISPEASRYVAAARDPRINEQARNGMLASEEHGVPHTAADLANAIVTHSAVRADARPLWQFARAVASHPALRDLPVVSLDEAVNRGYRREAPTGAAGYYDPGRNLPGSGFAPTRHIAIDPNTPSFVETGLHEITHALLENHLFSLEGTSPDHPTLRALNAIRTELWEHWSGMRGDTVPDEATRAALGHAAANIHETHAWAQTSPELQAFMRSQTASARLMGELRMAGYGPGEPGRSVWRTFTQWVRRTLGMNTPASASEYTLLDHVLRPVTDITEQGMRAAERDLPRDPVLRGAGEPMLRGVIDAARDKGEELRRYGGSMAMDRTRPATTAVTNMDQMVPRYRDLFGRVPMDAGNPIERVHAAMADIAHEAQQVLSGERTGGTFTDRVNDVTRDFKSLAPDKQNEIGDLLNQATIAQVHLDAPNPHLVVKNPSVTATRQAQEAALKARFAKLSPDEQRIEQAFVKIHGELGDLEHDARVQGVLKDVLPYATGPQKAEFVKMTKTKAGMEKFLADPDKSDLARVYGADWKANKELATAATEGLNANRLRGDYVPLDRDGDYAVAWGERGEPSEGLSFFRSRGAAEVARERLLSTAGVDPATVRHVDFTRKTELRTEMRNSPWSTRMERAMAGRKDLAPHAEAIRELMDKLSLEARTRSDASRIARRGIQGADINPDRVVASELRDQAARIGHLIHGGERTRAIEDMHKVADRLADPAIGQPGESRQARQVISDIEKRVTAQENPGGVGASLSRVANTFGFFQSLMSWSTALTHSMENYSMAIPQIGARHGSARASVELARNLSKLGMPALRTTGRNMYRALGGTLKASDWNLSKVFAKNLKDWGANGRHVDLVQGDLARFGLVDHSLNRELMRIANPRGVSTALSRTFEKFGNFMGAFQHSVDGMNRFNVAWSAFRLEYEAGIRKGLSESDAVAGARQYALERAREASPNYNLYNKNRFSTSAGMLGPMAPSVTQFKQYGFFAYGVLGNAIKQSLRGATPQARREARYAFAGMLATHAMTAGAFTLIADPLRYAMGLYDWITGATKPHDYQADLRHGLAQLVGPEWGQAIARGPVEALTGLSTHRRVGFANLLEMPDLESFDMAGLLKAAGTAAVGAAGEDAATFANGMQALAKGDIHGAFMGVMPRPIRDVMKAIDLSNHGVATQKGRVEVKPEDVSTGSVIAQGLGFTPTVAAEAREKSNAIQQAEQDATAARKDIVDRWLANPDDHSAMLSEIRTYNSDPAHTKITMSQLLRDMRQRQIQARTGAYGLKLPRRTAAALEQAGNF